MSRVRFFSLLILLAAFFYRLHRLPELPPGLNFDEAGSGAAVLDILQGHPKIWWRIGGGQEPLWPYLAAMSTLVLGYIPLALRLPAALASLLTVAAVYPLVIRLFRPQRAEAVALLEMACLAFSEWHLHFSRLGFRAILLPLLSTLAFYFFWRSSQKAEVSSQKSRSTYYVLRIAYYVLRNTQYVIRNTPHSLRLTLYSLLSSLFLALSIYAYLAARLLPLVVILFLVLSVLLHYWQLTRKGPVSLLSLMKPYLWVALRLFLPLFLFLLPLIIYFSFNPADFVARSTTVSLFNPAWNKGDLLGTAWQTVRLTLGTFLGLSGDPNPLVNLPDRPALPLWLAILFVIGWAACLKQLAGRDEKLTKGEQTPSTLFNPYLFLLCWWSVMLLPAILAPEGAPHHLRLIGTLTPTYILVALGLVTLIRGIQEAIRNTQYAIRNIYHPLRFTLYALLPLLLAASTYISYFNRWPASVDFTLPFDLYAVRLAGEIAQAPPEVAYILPMDIRAGAEARHYTLDYLLAPYQPRAYTYIPVDEAQAETLLAQASEGKNELRVVRWTADKHQEADAKEIVTYLLETSAQAVGRESFPVYDIETYRLFPRKSPGLNFDLPAIDRPVQANFDGLLKLEAAYTPATAKPGVWLPVALRLAPLAPMETNYKVSLRLVGPGGERLAQKDRTLLHNFHQGTSLWPPETVNEYYLLPIPREALPGDYQVVVVIYHPDTLAPLVAGGQVEVPVGSVKIE